MSIARPSTTPVTSGDAKQAASSKDQKTHYIIPSEYASTDLRSMLTAEANALFHIELVQKSNPAYLSIPDPYPGTIRFLAAFLRVNPSIAEKVRTLEFTRTGAVGLDMFADVLALPRLCPKLEKFNLSYFEFVPDQLDSCRARLLDCLHRSDNNIIRILLPRCFYDRTRLADIFFVNKTIQEIIYEDGMFSKSSIILSKDNFMKYQSQLAPHDVARLLNIPSNKILKIKYPNFDLLKDSLISFSSEISPGEQQAIINFINKYGLNGRLSKRERNSNDFQAAYLGTMNRYELEINTEGTEKILKMIAEMHAREANKEKAPLSFLFKSHERVVMSQGVTVAGIQELLRRSHY
jgi:hypothetical protein